MEMLTRLFYTRGKYENENDNVQMMNEWYRGENCEEVN